MTVDTQPSGFLHNLRDDLHAHNAKIYLLFHISGFKSSYKQPSSPHRKRKASRKSSATQEKLEENSASSDETRTSPSLDSGYEASTATTTNVETSCDESSKSPSDDESSRDETAELNKSQKSDALAIYQRYLSPDCPYPIPLSTKITQTVVQGEFTTHFILV